MLKQLYIKNFTLIDTLDIRFNNGFSVITGETGAGKSIILGAIGLSFNLDDIIIPPEKKEIVERGHEEIRNIQDNYNMGFITENERYNQVIDTWTHVNNDLASILMKEMTEADQGFNAVFMMLDSGARGSKDQIKQLSGMRGLMAKPMKAVCRNPPQR